VLKVLDASVRRALCGNESLLAPWNGLRTIYQTAQRAGDERRNREQYAGEFRA
jgi:hypothetical protein